MADHMAALLGDKKKREFSVYYKSGDKIKKLNDCEILAMDETGVTVLDKATLAPNKRVFIPMYNLVKIEQEFM